MVFLGPLLSISMSVIAFYLWQTIALKGQLGSHSRWTGSHEMTVSTFELFAAVFVFGLVALAAGIFQIRRGRPNKILVAMLFLLVAIMIFLGRAVTQHAA